MFEAEVCSGFSAAHAITIAGQPEEQHTHDWKVEVVVQRPDLDGDGLVVDFHLIQRALMEILAPFEGRCLNLVPPFDRVNPSAEEVARHIGDAIACRLPGAVTLRSVRVTEAIGCAARYLPPTAATESIRSGAAAGHEVLA